MALSAIQQKLGNLTLPPTPKLGRDLNSVQQATAVWTKQAQQTLMKLKEVLGQLDTSQIPEGTGSTIIGNTPTPPGVYFTPALGRSVLSATAPLLYDNSTGIFSIPAATALVDGYLTSVDWTTFNSKVGTTRAINTTAPLAGGGDLSADRTLTIADAKADATTKGAATFSVNDFDDNGSGLISLDYTNGQKASASVPGFLSTTDWSAFNAKVATTRAINTTAPLTGGGDLSADRTIAIPKATASVDGYLAAADFATFAAGGTPGDAKADGTTKGIATFTAADFNDNGAGLISLDYANGQKASATQPGFLAAADFATFATGGTPGDAKADGTTKGIATFTAADFNDNGAGLISFDYTNGQKASGSQPGLLTSTDWSTFNSKVGTARAINTTAPLSGGGDLSTDRTIVISQSTTSTDGYLSSTDWNTFNTKVGTARAINTTAPLAGGGNLSADRTLTIADAVADGATKGAATFAAADFNSSSGVISIDYTNGQKASGSQPGLLTSTDWTTFNSKVPTTRQILTTAPLTGGGDLSADRTLVIPKATASVDGYLAAADFTTFSAAGTSIVISSNRTYFVDVTNGNDANNGLASGSGHAFKTIQKAVNTVSSFFIAGGVVVTISIADGTYPEAVALSTLTGGGTVLIQGNTTTPANVIVQGGSADAFASSAFSPWTISGMEIRSTSGNGVSATSGLLNIGSAIRFGAVSIHHVIAQFGGIINFKASYAIVGSTTGGSHVIGVWGGMVNLFFGATVTLTGTPSFGQVFALAQTGSTVFAWSQTYSGSGTGKRYSATGNGVVDTNGAGATYFPGTVAGTVATGGQYI